MSPPLRSANFTNMDGDANSNYGQNVTWLDYVTDQLALAVNVYYTPILILFGCLGNLISIFIFYTSKLRMQSTSVYLSGLAVSDTLFLLQLLPPWLDAIHFSKIFYEPGFCQVIQYVSYVTCCLSTWIVVAFTVERYVAVLHPLQRSLICTVQRAKYIVLALTGFALILNIPVLKITTSTADTCSIDFQYMDEAVRFNTVDTFIAFTIPLGAIVVLNVRIILGVCKLESARHQLLKIEQEPGPSNARPAPTRAFRSQHRVTRMLLIVSTVFVVLNLPGYTMRVLTYTYDLSTVEHDARWAAFQQLALIFFQTNYGINFMLYCLTGQNFRRAFCSSIIIIIPCLQRGAIRSAGARRTARHPARASSISTSYASAGTEAANSMPLVPLAISAPTTVRRHRSEPIIKRWTFDNTRQRQQQDPTAEMETFSVGASTEHTMRHQTCDVDPQIRRIPFIFFPYRNLITPRHRNRGEHNRQQTYN